jgi:hypothetical protein
MAEAITNESVEQDDVHATLMARLYEKLELVDGDVSRIEVRRSTPGEYLYRIYTFGDAEYDGGILSTVTGTTPE